MGGDTTTTVSKSEGDPIAQQMAQEMQKQQWEMYQRVFLPYEEQLVAANRENIPWNTSLTRESLKSDLFLNPYRTDAQKMGLQEAMNDIQRGIPIKEQMNKLQMEAMTASEGLAGQFFDAARKPINVDDRIAQGVGDLNQQIASGEENAIRNAQRMGVDVNSPRFQEMLASQGMQGAMARTGAVTRSRRGAEQQELSNLALAMNAKNATQGLPGLGSMSMGALGADQQQQGVLNQGNFGLNSSIGGAMTAANMQGNFGQQTSSSTTTEKQGLMSTLGGVAGIGASMFAM